MARKLPRRVMSMSKRAGKLVEDASALLRDAEEEEQGEEEQSSSPTEEERPPAWAYVGAWLAAVAFLLAVMLGGRLIFTVGTGDGPGELGVQTREVSEPEYQAARDALREPTPTTGPPATAPVSRSGARTSDVSSIPTHYHAPADATIGGVPIPASVACHAQESIKLTLSSIVCAPPDKEQATVGGTTVPPLDCEEDEVIGFFGVPDTLVCIHIDSFR